MSSYTKSLQSLITEFASLPGIGPRSAERIAFHLLKLSTDDAMKLANAISDVKTRIKSCSICYNLTEEDPCEICQDPRRDPAQVCIVEQPKDLLALESAGAYKGVYHVLLGRIAPLEGAGPEDLTIPALMDRLAQGTIQEVIMGTNPTIEGDGTALYLTDQIKSRFPEINITRLARGLPAGAQIEYANKSILADALSGRRKL